MNLHLSDWEWLRVVTSLLFIWRGIQDLRDRSGTAWKTEDERKNFRKFSGVTLILGGAAFLFNTILPDIEPWNIILLVAAYLACIGFVISNPFSSCYNEKKRRRYFVMVKHIILWQLKDELSDAEKAAVKAGIKEGLEGLVGQVPGLLEVHVNINGLPTSNADVMLDTTLESFDALKGYAVHPAHVAVADGKVRPYTKTRVCMDYEV